MNYPIELLSKNRKELRKLAAVNLRQSKSVILSEETKESRFKLYKYQSSLIDQINKAIKKLKK